MPLIYCIVAKNYDKQTMLDKKSSTVRKNEMHLENVDIENFEIVPVLYQIGTLTIVDYDPLLENINYPIQTKKLSSLF